MPSLGQADRFKANLVAFLARERIARPLETAEAMIRAVELRMEVGDEREEEGEG